MKINYSKKTKSVISAILILSMIASLGITLPTSDAAVNKYHTWLYVGTSAGGGGVAPVGLGQTVLITAFTKDMPPDIGETAHLVDAPNGRAGWWGMQINLTKPDNTVEILDMPYSDPVGANYIAYTPTQLGTYYIQAIFPATWKNTTVNQNFYSAAVSPVDSFTVSNERVQAFPESPLPQDYWTRPVSGASRGWYVLEGNKLGGAANVWPIGAAGGTVSNYYYGQAPETAHVLWSKPYSVGGLMDERYNTTTFETTHYQGTNFNPGIILDGKIYFSPRMTAHQNQGLEVLDLYTGTTLYQNYTDSNFNFASIYNYNSPNQMGGFPYLWRQAGTNTGTGGLVTLQATTFSIPPVISLANATEDANCIMHRNGNDYTVNLTTTPVSLGTVWQLCDGWTMAPICLLSNVTQTEFRPGGPVNAQGRPTGVTTGATGTQVYGKDGSILYYNLANLGSVANPQYYLQVWNSSAGTMVCSVDGTGYWQWRPQGGQFGASNNYWATSGAVSNIVHNGAVFFSSNTSLPGGIMSPARENATIQCIRQDDFMIIGTQGWNGETVTKGWETGISLKPGEIGKKLWSMEYTPPYADPALNISKPAMFSGGMGLAGVYPEDGVLVWTDPQYCQRWVYDLYTGELLWTSPPEAQFEYYGITNVVYNHTIIGYGSYAGQFVCYDIRTGNQIWNYTATNMGYGDMFESPYGNYPQSIGAIADGKIYTVTSEHHNIQPMYRGYNLRCINAATGQEIFKTLCFGSGVSIADGILVKGNNLDNMIYAYGKGPSATTVCTSQDISNLGEKVMLKGTVTDQTASGRRNTNDMIDFTLQGTPAISDADMAAWMEYKFQQQGKPTNATGVSVSLDTIDPNGNFVHIGDTTSDMNGNYALPYTPDVPGTYKIIATFDGSRAYGPSSASTYLDVSEATTQPTTTPAIQAQSIADTYFLPATAALFILFVIVIAMLFVMMRKKP